MGRAQVMQAEAAGIAPSVLMNPVLFKAYKRCSSQVIVNGEVLGNMSARDYFKYKKKTGAGYYEGLQCSCSRK